MGAGGKAAQYLQGVFANRLGLEGVLAVVVRDVGGVESANQVAGIRSELVSEPG